MELRCRSRSARRALSAAAVPSFSLRYANALSSIVSKTVRRLASSTATAASPPTALILSSALFRMEKRSRLRASSSSKRLLRTIVSASNKPRSIFSRMVSACSMVSTCIPSISSSRTWIDRPSRSDLRAERAQASVDFHQGPDSEVIHHQARLRLHVRGFVSERASPGQLDCEPQFRLSSSVGQSSRQSQLIIPSRPGRVRGCLN